MAAYYPGEWTPHPAGVAAAVLQVCEASPASMEDVRAVLRGSSATRSNRLHELKEAGLVRVTVEITEEGLQALQRMRAKHGCVQPEKENHERHHRR